MVTFVTIIFVIVSLVMVLAILLQAGKGGGMGTALGGAASQGVFGGGGQADFMAKLTQGFAATFMISAMYLAYASAHAGSDFLAQEDQGGSTLFEDDQEFDPERVGHNPLVLPSEDEAKQMQAAAKVSVPAQTPADVEAPPAIDPPPADPVAAPVEAPTAVVSEGSDSIMQETPPPADASIREGAPAQPGEGP
jgi:preprotein translocase subunit SecG